MCAEHVQINQNDNVFTYTIKSYLIGKIVKTEHDYLATLVTGETFEGKYESCEKFLFENVLLAGAHFLSGKMFQPLTLEQLAC